MLFDIISPVIRRETVTRALKFLTVFCISILFVANLSIFASHPSPNVFAIFDPAYSCFPAGYWLLSTLIIFSVFSLHLPQGNHINFSPRRTPLSPSCLVYRTRKDLRSGIHPPAQTRLHVYKPAIPNWSLDIYTLRFSHQSINTHTQTAFIRL